jgi:hypothetical protein
MNCPGKAIKVSRKVAKLKRELAPLASSRLCARFLPRNANRIHTFRPSGSHHLTWVMGRNCSITLGNLAQRAISGTGALPKKRGRQAFSRQTPPARQPKELARSPEFLEKDRVFSGWRAPLARRGVAGAAILNPQAAA